MRTNTISWEEYELLSYDLRKLHNNLSDYTKQLEGHPHLVGTMTDVMHSVTALINDLKNQSIIS